MEETDLRTLSKVLHDTFVTQFACLLAAGQLDLLLKVQIRPSKSLHETSLT